MILHVYSRSTIDLDLVEYWASLECNLGILISIVGTILRSTNADET